MSSEKTEKPSSHRLGKARDKGQIPRSKDLGMAIILVVIASLALPLFARLGNALSQILTFNLSLTHEEVHDPAQMLSHLGQSLIETLLALLPLAGLIIAVGVLAHIVMGGWNFSLEPLLPQFSRVSPMKGFKRIFGMQSLAEFTKSVLKIVVISATILLYVRTESDTIAALYYIGLKDSVRMGMAILVDGIFLQSVHKQCSYARTNIYKKKTSSFFRSRLKMLL